MTVDEYEDEILKLWPEPGQAPPDSLVRVCAQAVTDHHESSDFWYTFGIVMERCAENYGFTANDYRSCYEKSIECDSGNAEAHQELGYVLEVYFGDYNRATEAFSEAIRLGAGRESYYGYARVLAEQGRTNDAVESLSVDSCPFWNHPDIEKLRTEISSGSWSPVEIEKGGGATFGESR
jgi:tetratricopeptide (TPR) repeat protein